MNPQVQPPQPLPFPMVQETNLHQRHQCTSHHPEQDSESGEPSPPNKSPPPAPVKRRSREAAVPAFQELVRPSVRRRNEWRGRHRMKFYASEALRCKTRPSVLGEARRGSGSCGLSRRCPTAFTQNPLPDFATRRAIHPPISSSPLAQGKTPKAASPVPRPYLPLLPWARHQRRRALTIDQLCSFSPGQDAQRRAPPPTKPPPHALGKTPKAASPLHRSIILIQPRARRQRRRALSSEQMSPARPGQEAKPRGPCPYFPRASSPRCEAKEWVTRLVRP